MLGEHGSNLTVEKELLRSLVRKKVPLVLVFHGLGEIVKVEEKQLKLTSNKSRNERDESVLNGEVVGVKPANNLEDAVVLLQLMGHVLGR